MNNCGYNPIHTDYVGGSVKYPNASYAERDASGRHTLSMCKAISGSCQRTPCPQRTAAFANVWGLCADEFVDDHFPPQLYVRESRRMVGIEVFRQDDVGARPLALVPSVWAATTSTRIASSDTHARGMVAPNTRTRTRRGTT